MGGVGWFGQWVKILLLVMLSKSQGDLACKALYFFYSLER